MLRETAEAFESVEDGLFRKTMLLHDRLHLIHIGVFGGSAAAPTSEAAVRAPGIASAPGNRPQAGFAQVEEAGIFVCLAFHTDRIFWMYHGLPDHEIRHDFFDFLLLYRTAINFEVQVDEGIERFCRIVCIDGEIAVDLLFYPGRIFEPVPELVHPAETGAGAEGNENLRVLSDGGKMPDFVGPRDASFDKGDVVVVGFFPSWLPGS